MCTVDPQRLLNYHHHHYYHYCNRTDKLRKEITISKILYIELLAMVSGYTFCSTLALLSPQSNSVWVVGLVFFRWRTRQ